MFIKLNSAHGLKNLERIEKTDTETKTAYGDSAEVYFESLGG